MTYKNLQEMILSFLSNIDYTKPWEDIEYGMAYDLGDYNFGERHQEACQKIRFLAYQNWLVLNPFFDKEGN